MFSKTKATCYRTMLCRLIKTLIYKKVYLFGRTLYVGGRIQRFKSCNIVNKKREKKVLTWNRLENIPIAGSKESYGRAACFRYIFV